ncbi:MAG TPA: hypothetical protein ENN61_05210 [Bacteroidaceae bacterium]|nr:hypothetical protein [Bacteroidaceae bacterium]
MKEPFSYRKRGIKGFIIENLVPILYTLIFHVIVLIILIFVKVEGLKEIRELGVLIDFEEKTIEEILEETLVEIPAEFIEMIYHRREMASNRAVNISEDDPLNRELSTDEYLKQLLDEIEAGRDEEIIRDRDAWREILESGGYIEPVPEPDELEEEEQYTGPTTITYRFLDEPLDRGKIFLTIPVYRCRGEGLVNVDALVVRNGSVIQAEVRKPLEGWDAVCFSEAALKAALSSRFRVNPYAPEKQRVVITYTFIAQ